ncbi:MAG: 50S ribosomal protein L29 [Stenotrophobium sp.]
MKTAEYIKGLRGKNAQELNSELEALRKEQFNLRMQKALGQQSKSNLVRVARKNIARTKTVMRQQVKMS